MFVLIAVVSDHLFQGLDDTLQKCWKEAVDWPLSKQLELGLSASFSMDWMTWSSQFPPPANPLNQIPQKLLSLVQKLDPNVFFWMNIVEILCCGADLISHSGMRNVTITIVINSDDAEREEASFVLHGAVSYCSVCTVVGMNFGKWSIDALRLAFQLVRFTTVSHSSGFFSSCVKCS